MSEPEVTQPTTKHKMAGTELKIFIDDEGKVGVTGPLNDTILSLELIKVGTQTILQIAQQNHAAQKAATLTGLKSVPGKLANLLRVQ